MAYLDKPDTSMRYENSIGAKAHARNPFGMGLALKGFDRNFVPASAPFYGL